MAEKSILKEINDAHIAMELISFGARMQVLESETSLSRRRLLRLYKEMKGCSPPKGLLPFSPDWFMTWEQNVHASMFYNIFLFLHKTRPGRNIEHILVAYKLYLEQCINHATEKPLLGITRAWTLIRFTECGMIDHIRCCHCSGIFIVTASHLCDKQFVCRLCCIPSRAVKKLVW